MGKDDEEEDWEEGLPPESPRMALINTENSPPNLAFFGPSGRSDSLSGDISGSLLCLERGLVGIDWVSCTSISLMRFAVGGRSTLLTVAAAAIGRELLCPCRLILVDARPATDTEVGREDDDDDDDDVGGTVTVRSEDDEDEAPVTSCSTERYSPVSVLLYLETKPRDGAGAGVKAGIGTKVRAGIGTGVGSGEGVFTARGDAGTAG